MTLERSIPFVLTVICAVALFGMGRTELRSRRITSSGKGSAGQDGEPDLNLAGTIGPTITVPVMARNFRLCVPINSAVHKGEVIGVEEPAGTTAEVDAAQQELRAAESAERQAVDTVRRLEEQLAAAESRTGNMDREDVEAGMAEYDAEREFERDDRLYRFGLASRYDYDAAVLARASAGAAVDSVRSNLSEAAIDTDEWEAAAVDARTDLREAAARRAAAQAIVERLGGAGRARPVVSPADGFIVQSPRPAGTSFGIASNCRLFAYAMVAEAELMRVRVGQEASIALDCQPSELFPAQVIAIAESPVDSPDGSFYELTFAVKNHEGPWLTSVAMHAHMAGPAVTSRAGDNVQ